MLDDYEIKLKQMTTKKHEIQKEVSELIRQKHAHYERDIMSVEDSRSAVMREFGKVEELRLYVDTQRSSFKEDITNKEQQLQKLVNKKQCELEHYELCLRKEALEISEREDALDRQIVKHKEWKKQ